MTTTNNNSRINVGSLGDQSGDPPSAAANSLLIDTGAILESTVTDPVEGSAHDLDMMHCILCNAALSDPFSHKCDEQSTPQVMEEEAGDPGVASEHIVDVVSENAPIAEDQDAPVDEQEKDVYVCEKCGQSFDLIQNFRRHQHKHSEDLSFKCDQCGKAYKWAGSLEYHVDSVHSLNEYICNVCLKKFKTKGTLLKHKKMPGACTKNMNRPKNLTCDDCGKTMSTVGNYKRHIPKCKAKLAEQNNINLP